MSDQSHVVSAVDVNVPSQLSREVFATGEQAAETNMDSVGSSMQGESHGALFSNIYGSRREMQHLTGTQKANNLHQQMQTKVNKNKLPIHAKPSERKGLARGPHAGRK